MEKLKELKSLPHDIEVERALLCAILLDEDYNAKLNDINLEKEYFYKSEHKVIFEAIHDLEMETQQVDMLTLKNQLVKMNKLTEAGGLEYILTVINTISTSANLYDYAKIVEDKFLLRELIKTNTNSAEKAYSETEDSRDLLDKVSSELFQLAEKKTSNHPLLIEKAAIDTFEQILQWSSNDGDLSGITTGYKELDEYTSGWQKNALIVVAARPGMGKTQIALNFAMNAMTAKEPTTVAMFSLEMGRNELAMRIIAMESEISLQKLKKGKLDKDAGELHRLTNAMERVYRYPLLIDDSSSLNVLDIRTKCRRLKKEHNIGLVIVDYIGLMDTEKNVERHEGISKISRALKGLARELEIPVMVLAQLNREVDKRPDKRPLLSDLRDSGAIEQDADIVMFIMRPEIYKIADKEAGQIIDGLTEVIIAKQRSGPTGTVELMFDKKSMKFHNFDRQDYLKFMVKEGDA